MNESTGFRRWFFLYGYKSVGIKKDGLLSAFFCINASEFEKSQVS